MKEEKNIFYPIYCFRGIKGMNGKTMTANMFQTDEVTGRIRSTVPRPAELEREVAQDLFLKNLQPVKLHLYNFIRKALNYIPEADDLFQETLLKGFRYFYSYDQEHSFKTWIFTIAHNLVKSFFCGKLGAARRMVSLEETGDLAIPEEHAAIAGQVREIYRLATGLKPRQREVFFLYYYNEFSVAEISAICGMSRPGVKFILHQARTTIKKIVEVQR